MTGTSTSSLSRTFSLGLKHWLTAAAVVILATGATPALAAVDMNISSFTDSPDPVPAGGNVTYDLRIENSGADATAEPGTLIFALPASTTFVSVSAPRGGTCAYTLATHQVDCDFGIMAGTLVDPNAFRTVSIVARTSAAGVITAEADVFPMDGNPANNSLDVNTTVDNGADLHFQTFSAAPNPVTASGIATYSVVISNLGPNTANGLSITFNLPPGLQYDSADNTGGWSCTSAAPQVTCTNAGNVIAAATAPTLTWRTKVTSNIVGTLRTSGTVTSGTADGNLTNNTATADVTVQAGTDLSVVKTVSANPMTGASAITFGLNVTNNGPFVANTVQVTDTIPAGFTGISALGTGWTCNVAGSTVTCTRATLAVGSAPIAISATAPDNASIPVGGVDVTNSATVTSATADPISSNDTGSVTFRLLQDGADLRPTMSRGPSPVPLNSDITTTLRVRNNGPRTATGPLRITYQLANGESLQSFSGTGWTCAPLSTAAALVTCDRTAISGGIAANASSNPVALVTRTTVAGTVLGSVCTSGTAGVAPVEGDIDPSNDCVTNDGSVVASSTTADLQLVKTASPAAPTALAPGDNRVTYTLTVTNAGPDDATSVTLTDPLPMYAAAFNGRPATTVGASVAGGTGGTCSVGSTVTCDLGTVIVGTPKVVTVTVDRPMRDGSWRNTADVFSSAIGDSNRANNVASADIVVQPLTDIELTSKTVTPTTVKSGVEATYVITLRNNGPSDAANVTVTDTIAAMGANGTYTFISATASDGGTCPTAPASGISAAFPIVCNFGTVPATGVRSMSVVIRPDYMVTPPTPRTIQNTATVTTTTQESNPANNSRNATLTIDTDLIDVLIEETDVSDPVGFSPATPNTNVIVYKVDVTNRGPSLATGVQFTDTTTPPAGKSLTFMCDRTTAPPTPHDTTTACTVPPTCTGTNPVTCSIGQMAATSSTTRYLVYRVNDAPASTGDTYNKTATVSANENETLMANNSDPEQTTIRMLADMQLVSKTPSISPANLNQPFVWTIVGRNNGPGSSTNTRLTDTLPAGMVLTGTPTYALSTGPTGNCTGSVGGNNVSCTFGDLAINDTATVTVPVRLTAYPSGGTSTNTARVFTDSIDPTPGNDSRDGVVNANKSSIACTVFADTNDDGVKQPTEGGIGSVSVRLTGTDLYGNNLDVTTTTNGSGACLFDNLPPSDATGYTLTETHPAGYLDGKDNKAGTVIPASKGTDTITAIVLNPNQALTGYTFGELQTASIAGRVWHDVSDNGVIEGSETQRISGVTITLTGIDDQGAPVNTNQLTNGSGAYAFTNLRPGTYTLTQTQPSGWLEGRAATGTGVTGVTGTPDNTLASPTYGNIIANIELQSGNAGVEYNFGELQPASVAGLVWYDADNSGAQNGAEPVIPSVTVTLSGTDYRGAAVAPQVQVTGPTGTYSFTSLKPGTYIVTETQPTDYSDGQLQLGTVNTAPIGTAGVNVFNGIVLPSAGAGINYNFGERGRGIAGTVYADDNDDGIKQGGEVGIPGVQITLTGCTINRTVATDASGNYNFSGLPDCPGGYTVVESQPAGFSDGKDTAGTAGGAVTNDRIAGIVLGATTYASSYNFGEHGIVATDISCTSPVPAPAKNVREPFNWTFSVNHVSGGAAPNTRLSNTLPAGMQLTGVPTLSNGGTCTGAAGQTSYVCTVGFLAPAQVVTVTAPVRVMSFPAGGTLTNTSTVATDGNDLVNTANNTCQSAVTIQQATIAGTVYEDPNNDGVKQPTENGIPNVSIRLTGTDLYNNPVDTTIQTIANGTYQFTGLAPSNPAGYTLAETQPSSHADGRDTAGSKGGTVTNDNIAAIPLLAAENATDYNFGEIGQGLAGTVYVDSNDNGIRDPGERGIPNVSIRVTGTSFSNTPVDVTMTTDVDGNYLFGGLPASNAAGYTVVETQPAAWADGKDKVGTVGGTVSNDRLDRVVLPAGRIGTGYDFGERGARVCGYVYSDRNDNAIKDTTEVGIPAATITLTGTDIDGNAITRTALTTDLTVVGGDLGRYCITDLPLPNGAGYTLTETQPPDTTDGRDSAGTLGGTAGNDVITGIRITTPGATGENYNFGERITNAAALSGFVWFDANHDRVRDLTGRGGWTVELVRGTVGASTTTIATTQTAPDGSYRFDGLPPGSGYSIVFRNPQGNYIYGYINNVTLAASTELTEQNQPIDPSGVVYDVLTRQPVAGAVVRIDGPAGFDPALHLVGGPANVAQTTDATGEYKFLLLPGTPTGTYRLSTTVPSGYIQRVSTALPVCTATLQVGGVPNPALVQRSDTAPAASVTQHNPNTCPSTSAAIASNNNTTQYYLAFVLGAGSANVINNHIPVERNPTSDTLIVTKTTPKAEVSRGELVPYTITVRNTLDLRQTDIAIQDQIPPGFQYRVGSAQIEGQRREPTTVGRQLTWGPLTIERNQVVTLKMLLVVGTGVGTGEFVNQAWASSTVTNAVISNVAKATVRVVPDATFDCSEVIGKVFDDKNRNGVQDDGEAGIANARLATVRGQLVTTDQYGRFHIACADIPDEDRGSNYVLKLDERTLPTGYRLTTENPGLVRLTRGKMSKINFGASTQRVVRVDLKDLAFAPNATALLPQWSASLDQLLPLLQQEQSVLRLAYGRTAQEDPKLAQNRMQDVVKIIRSNWRQFGGNYPLSIETEVYQSGGGSK